MSERKFIAELNPEGDVNLVVVEDGDMNIFATITKPNSLEWEEFVFSVDDIWHALLDQEDREMKCE